MALGGGLSGKGRSHGERSTLGVSYSSYILGTQAGGPNQGRLAPLAVRELLRPAGGLCEAWTLFARTMSSGLLPSVDRAVDRGMFQ